VADTVPGVDTVAGIAVAVLDSSLVAVAGFRSSLARRHRSGLEEVLEEPLGRSRVVEMMEGYICAP